MVLCLMVDNRNLSINERVAQSLKDFRVLVYLHAIIHLAVPTAHICKEACSVLQFPHRFGRNLSAA